MMEHGSNAESAPSLWIVVPIVTVLTIALMRQSHGMHVHFGGYSDPGSLFAFLTRMLAVQIAFAMFGWIILRRLRYFGRFVTGPELSPGSYALVCPGVALVVMGQLFLNKALVSVGLVDKFSLAFWIVTAAILMLQAATVWLVLRLNAKHFRASPEGRLAHS